MTGWRENKFLETYPARPESKTSQGAEIDSLKNEIQKMTHQEVFINILSAENLRWTPACWENNASHLNAWFVPRAMKRSVTSSVKFGGQESESPIPADGRSGNGPYRKVP
jgi:hypothetical protein